MNEIRKAYLEAAESAAGLLATPEVAAAWGEPSALPEFSVSGLCGHLASQVFSVTEARVSGQGLIDQPQVPLLAHYLRTEWMDAPLDAEIHVLIRDSGERTAGTDPADLVRRLREHIGGQRGNRGAAFATKGFGACARSAGQTVAAQAWAGGHATGTDSHRACAHEHHGLLIRGSAWSERRPR